MTEARTDNPYWSHDAGALAAMLGSGPSGLSSAAAAERLRTTGPNSVEETQQLDALRLLGTEFPSIDMAGLFSDTRLARERAHHHERIPTAV